MAIIEQTKADELLDPAFMRRLDQLALVSRKIFAGKMRGERLTKKRGESAEFADYRLYVSGDDLRFLDWNIYARLDQLFLKLFLQEEDLHVSILLDMSESMNWGEPNKWLYARQIAAAITYIGLVNFDRVSLYGYANGLQRELTGIRGRRWMFKSIEFLTHLETDGVSHLSEVARQFAIRHPQPGICLPYREAWCDGGRAVCRPRAGARTARAGIDDDAERAGQRDAGARRLRPRQKHVDPYVPRPCTRTPPRHRGAQGPLLRTRDGGLPSHG